MYGIEDLEEVLGELRARREGEAKKAQDVALPGVGSGLPRVRPVERGSRQDDQNRFRGRSRRLWVAAASSHPSLDPHQAKRNKRETLEGVANRIRSHSKILIKPCMDFIHFQFISSITLFHPGLKPILGRLKKTTLFLSRIKV